MRERENERKREREGRERERAAERERERERTAMKAFCGIKNGINFNQERVPYDPI